MEIETCVVSLGTFLTVLQPLSSSVLLIQQDNRLVTWLGKAPFSKSHHTELSEIDGPQTILTINSALLIVHDCLVFYSDLNANITGKPITHRMPQNLPISNSPHPFITN